jgi:hypothetical protein
LAVRKEAAPPGALHVPALCAGLTAPPGCGCRKPYTLGDTPVDLVNKWGKATLDHYLELYFSPEAGEAGGEPLL